MESSWGTEGERLWERFVVKSYGLLTSRTQSVGPAIATALAVSQPVQGRSQVLAAQEIMMEFRITRDWPGSIIMIVITKLNFEYNRSMLSPLFQRP